MSMQDYEAATKIIARYPTKGFFVGPRSISLIETAERALGLKFPPTYRRFLLEYGAGSFGASEVYGVIDDDYEESSVPDGIWYTLVERRQVGLPNDLIVIYDLGGYGEIFCLDLGMLRDEEAPVIAYHPGYPVEEQHKEIISKDFGEFLLTLVQDEEARIAKLMAR